MDRPAPLGRTSLLGCLALSTAIVLGTAAPGSGQSADTPLRISPDAAVTLALANNLRLESARRSPAMADYDVRAAASASPVRELAA